MAIPTTAGTAAEVTINYVITDEAQRRKFVCVDPHDIPQVAFIDADMMDGMPPALKAATGVDALTHAIEGYITRAAWALTDALHIKAIEVIAGALRDSVAGDSQAGEAMALGQYIAGMGFSNVGLGLVHGMAHPLGAFYNTPHGVANAILLPHVMRYNADFSGEKFRDIARAMGEKVDGVSLEQARQSAVDAVFRLNRDVGIPRICVTSGSVKRIFRRWRRRLLLMSVPGESTGGQPGGDYYPLSHRVVVPQAVTAQGDAGIALSVCLCLGASRSCCKLPSSCKSVCRRAISRQVKAISLCSSSFLRHFSGTFAS
jgi:hypothetical protein